MDWCVRPHCAIALLVTAVGLYGVISQSVLRSTRELAVRMAIGATPRRILRTVLDDGVRMMLTGVVIGGLGAVGLWRVIQALLPLSGPST